MELVRSLVMSVPELLDVNECSRVVTLRYLQHSTDVIIFARSRVSQFVLKLC